MKNNLIIMGYNNKNLGDDLMFASIVNHTEYKKYFFYGMEIQPNFVNKPVEFIKYGRALPFRWKFFSDLALIGGSVLMGATTSQQKMLQQKHRFFMFNKFYGGDNYIVGANLGPFEDKNKYLAQLKKLNKLVNKWLVRDTYSANLLTEIKTKKYIKMPDMVMGFDVEPYLSLETLKVVSISVTEVSKDGKGAIDPLLYIKEIKTCIELYVKQGYTVNLLSFEDVTDLIVIDNILKIVDEKYKHSVNVIGYESDNVIKSMAVSEIIISTRFHCMVLGALLKKDQIIYSYSKKTQNFATDYSFNTFTISGDVNGKHPCHTSFSEKEIELAKQYPLMMRK